jgi:tyrosine-protein kinase Etk/Wzc
MENSAQHFSLARGIHAIKRQWRIVLGFPAIVGVITLMIVLLLPKWYLAQAKILPPQQTQSNAVAILGQLGALAGGASQALGIKNPSDIYATMLKSRTIADALIARFDLKKVYDEELLTDTRKELARNSSISVSREGVITIEFEDKDPQRAVMVTNAYVEELRKLTVHLAVSEASQRRLFFEGQLHKAKNDLAAAEAELQQFTKSEGLVNPQGQIGLTVGASAALRAQITAKEIQLAGVRSFATESNPEVTRLTQELVGLRSEMAKMEKKGNAGVGDVLVPFGKASDVGLEYIRKYRNMRYVETLYEVLAKQYEIARIDEAKDATLIQVLDSATPPERHSRPKRSLVTMLMVILASIISVGFVVVVDMSRGSR